MRSRRFAGLLSLCAMVGLCGCWSRSMEKLGFEKIGDGTRFFYKDNWAFFLWPLPPMGVGWSSLQSFSIEAESPEIETLQQDFFCFALFNPMFPTVLGEEQIKTRDERFKREFATMEDTSVYLYHPKCSVRRPVFYMCEYLFFYRLTKTTEGKSVLLWKKDSSGNILPMFAYSGEIKKE